MLHSSLVTQQADFNGLRGEWTDLIACSSSATIFDTYEWQFNWWIHFGCRIPGATLCLVLLRLSDGTLVGILPFYTRLWKFWPVRQLCFLGSGASDYHDIIAADAFEDVVMEAFQGWLANDDHWSVADFSQLRERGLVRRHSKAFFQSSLVVKTHKQEECPYLSLPSAEPGELRWNALLDCYSKKMRGNVRYYDRALDKVYHVERKLASTDMEVDEALAALFVLHQRRWNQRWLPGVFYSGSVRKFHVQTAKDLLKAGRLRLHSIRLDETIEAVLYCFSINGVTSYYQGGFEPSLAKLSLGSVITGLAIRQAAFEGSDIFDFLRGDEPYKRRWTNGSSSWNERWIVARQSTIIFAAAVALVQFELRVEQRFKEWMHHRKNGS